MIDRIKSDFEQRGFEVCHRLGTRMGIPVSRIRLFFIYASFITLGSPLILYMGLAFLLRLMDDFGRRRESIFDL